MYPIFNKKKLYFFRYRLFFYITLSIITIIFDIRFGIFSNIQNHISYSYFFIQSLTDIPKTWLNIILQSLKKNKQLILENNFLKKELFIKNSELLLIEYYKQERSKLYNLLSSPLFYNEKKILANVIADKTEPYISQIIINKGTNDGVYIGQPLIDDQGIIGQVITTNKFTSQVLLICDISHALPVQILRNNTRMILKGNGYKKNLQLKHLPNDPDIQIGDILITSGLGGRFPIGYPVARISLITIDNKTGYITAQAIPFSKLNNLSYVLLIWNIKEYITTPLSADMAYQISNKRLELYKKKNKIQKYRFDK